MPQCKMSNCREPALPTGKRYCAKHKDEYLRKQRAAEARPVCAGGCGNKTSRMDPRNMWTPLCGRCQQDREAAERLAVHEENERDRIDNVRTLRSLGLSEANSVGALKAWLEEHVVPVLNEADETRT